MPQLNPDVMVVREGNGEPLMLLHCLGVDHRFWDFARPLGTDFTLYRYDLPGHGISIVPNAAYTIADLSDQVAAVMEKHGVARASVAGISLGGLIAQHLAASRPERVSRLILIDTTPRYTDEMRAMWAERAAMARSKGVVVVVEALLNIWFSASALANETDGVRYVRAALTRCNGDGYALACEALALADLRGLTPHISAPTLVICGDDDIPSFLDSARWLAGHIPKAELAWIAGARHASVLEKPEEALRLIRAFLAVSGA
jgi:3-oxoadipate enol-lactonase